MTPRRNRTAGLAGSWWRVVMVSLSLCGGAVLSTGSAGSPAMAAPPSVAEAGPDVILDQTMKVRFDASLEAGMPWEFKPAAGRR